MPSNFSDLSSQYRLSKNSRFPDLGAQYKIPDIASASITKPPTSYGGIGFPKTGYGGAIDYAPSTMKTLADLQIDPLNLKANPLKIFEDMGKQVDQQAAAAAEAIKGVFSEPTTAGKIGKGLEAGAGLVGLAISPITTLFTAADDIPVVGTISKLISLPFAVMGDGGRAYAYDIVNKLPISDDAKEKIVGGLGDVISLAGQLSAGELIHQYEAAPSEITKQGTFPTYIAYTSGGLDLEAVKSEWTKKYGEQDATTMITMATEMADYNAKNKPKPVKPFPEVKPDVSPIPEAAPDTPGRIVETPADTSPAIPASASRLATQARQAPDFFSFQQDRMDEYSDFYDYQQPPTDTFFSETGYDFKKGDMVYWKETNGTVRGGKYEGNEIGKSEVFPFVPIIDGEPRYMASQHVLYPTPELKSLNDFYDQVVKEGTKRVGEVIKPEKPTKVPKTEETAKQGIERLISTINSKVGSDVTSALKSIGISADNDSKAGFSYSHINEWGKFFEDDIKSLYNDFAQKEGKPMITDVTLGKDPNNPLAGIKIRGEGATGNKTIMSKVLSILEEIKAESERNQVVGREEADVSGKLADLTEYARGFNTAVEFNQDGVLYKQEFDELDVKPTDRYVSETGYEFDKGDPVFWMEKKSFRDKNPVLKSGIYEGNRIEGKTAIPIIDGKEIKEKYNQQFYPTKDMVSMTNFWKQATKPEKVSGIDASILPEFQPLAQEARKYKSAEEFVKAQGENGNSGIQHGGSTIFEKYPDNYSKSVVQKDIVGDTVLSDIHDLSAFKLKDFQPREGFANRPKIIQDESGSTFAYLKTPFEKLNKTAQYELSRPNVYVTENNGKTFFQTQETIGSSGKTKSQLTDIWNKAQEGKGEIDASMMPGARASKAEAAKIRIDAARGKVDKVVEDIVKPKVGGIFAKMSEFWDFAKKQFDPKSRSPEAFQAQMIMRRALSTMARKIEISAQALQKAGKVFRTWNHEQITDFIDKAEKGLPTPPGTEEFAKLMRTALDVPYKEIVARKGVKAYIENYWPHLWKNPKLAVDIIKRSYGKYPFKGTAGFLKYRSIESFKEGLALGLEPVSWDPIAIVMSRVADMNRFLMADDVLSQFKENGLMKFVKYGKDRPPDWGKVNDPLTQVFFKPTIKEYFDEKIMEGLDKLAEAFGIEHERRISGGGLRGKMGFSVTGMGKIKTRFATPEDVLMHEIGHAINDKLGAWDKIVTAAEGIGKRGKVTKGASTRARITVEKELRKLADLRWEGKEVSESFKHYVRKEAEKMAVMFQAYLHAPEKFKKVAPHVYDAFEKFLDSDPRLTQIKDIKPSLVYGSKEYEMNVLAKAGDWYMPQKVADIMNNYLSTGYRDNPYYNAYRKLGNIMNQVQLGLSGFHALFTSGDAVVSKVAVSVQEAFSKSATTEERIKAGLTAITAPVMAPKIVWDNIIRGNKLLKDYYRENPYIPELVDALEKAGGRVTMDKFYLNNSVENFYDALKARSPLGVLWNSPGAIMETVARPIMQELVPRQKLGVFADAAEFILKKAERENWSEYKTTMKLQEMWDSVDNRMGQLVYDNLFWDKAIKDLGMASVRSLGWNIGTFRELGGGAIELGKVPGKLLTEKGRASITMTPKMAYTMSLPVVVGLWGAVIYYIYNKEGPQEMLDYYYPKTGRIKPDGTPERIALPSYMKDIFALKTEGIVKTAASKAQPELGAIYDMFTNRNYYGGEIRNPNDPLVKQLGSLMAYQASQFQPFTLSNLQQRLTVEGKGKGSWMDYLQSFGGIMPAPAYITRTPLQTKIYDLYDRRFAGVKSQQEVADNKVKSTIRTKYITGDDAGANADLKDAVAKGIIKPDGVAQFIKEADIPNDVKLFDQLPASDQEAMLKDMDLYQLRRYAWHANTSVRNKLSTLSETCQNFVDMYKAGEVSEPVWKRQKEVTQS